MPDVWDRAEAYERFMGRWSRLLAPKFLAWADPPQDGEVLDVGSGTGVLSEALLARGARAVIGIEPSPAYVAHASSRLAAGGRASFQEGTATELPFADGRFAAAVSSLVLNFVPDPPRAVREMRRVVRDGGIVAACVWDYAGSMEMLRRFWDAAVLVRPEAREEDEGVRFPLCRPDRLARLFREAGFSEVNTAAIDVPTVFPGFDEYWESFVRAQGAAGAFVKTLGEQDRARLRELLQGRLRPEDDGPLSLVARAWAVCGTK